MKKIFLLLAWCLCSFSIQARTLEFQIIPQPQHIEMHKGRGINYDEIRFIITNSISCFRFLSGCLATNGKTGQGCLSSYPYGKCARLSRRICFNRTERRNTYFVQKFSRAFLWMPDFGTADGRQQGFSDSDTIYENNRLSGRFLSGSSSGHQASFRQNGILLSDDGQTV